MNVNMRNALPVFLATWIESRESLGTLVCKRDETTKTMWNGRTQNLPFDLEPCYNTTLRPGAPRLHEEEIHDQAEEPDGGGRRGLAAPVQQRIFCSSYTGNVRKSIYDDSPPACGR